MTPADREFLKQFDDCMLPESQFGHDGHVRMAWLRLSEAAFEDALVQIRGGIQRYASSKNAPTKYHETVTVAFATIIAARIRPGESFDEFSGRNPDVFSPRPLLQAHYSANVLNSARAKQKFVEPDLAPLPEAE